MPDEPALQRIELWPHPAATAATVFAEVRAGDTLAQMLGEAIDNTLRVDIGGRAVPRALWPLVKPKAGQTIAVTARPKGGGNSNKLLKLVVLVVAAAYLWYTGFTDWAGAGQIVAYGFTAVNILVPPPQPKLAGAGDPFNTLASLTGTQNQASPYSPIPLVIGTCTFFPPHAALPYTEIAGDDQYLRMMLDCGYGDLDISDIKIGETPIESYDDVEWEVTTTPTLFTQDVFELQVGTVLNASGDSDTRTGQNLSNEMSVDLQFPSGLFAVDKKGRSVTARVYVDISYREVGTATWYGIYLQPGISLSSPAAQLDLPNNRIVISSQARKTLRVGVRWKQYGDKQYEVKVARLGTTWDTSIQQFTDMTWTVLRSFSNKSPSTTGTTKLVLRIKATNQLQGVVSTVNVKATQRIRTYNPATGAWTTGVATGNNAWVYHWLLTACPAVARHVNESRVDLDGIVDWAAECAAMSFEYNHVEQSGRTLFELLQDVLASGRATFGMPQGKYGCVRDVPQAVPVQMFTPSNSSSFSGQRTFYDPPHALRCQWTNPEANNQEDELVVYANGYSAANATRYEPMDLRACTNPTAVWRLATYHLAAAAARTTVDTFNADMEYLVCQRGDLVMHAHDVVDWGLSSGRVKAVVGDRIVLDGEMALDPGKSYGLRVRRFDGAQHETGLSSLITWDSTYIRLDMDHAWDANVGPTRVFTLGGSLDVEPGDLYVLGEVGQITRPVIVQRIEPLDDLSARLTVVDAAPDVPLAGTGAPPGFVSQITGKPWCAAPDAPQVHVRIGNSGPDDAGVIHAAAGVSGNPTSGIYRIPIRGCVTVDSLVRVREGGTDALRRAGDIRVGDTLVLFDESTLEPRTGVVSYSVPVWQPCVEITTASRKVLTCSTSAPLPTRRAGLKAAPDLAGQEIAVYDGDGRWEAVKTIRVVGLRQVQHITCENGCFWANGVGHHNRKPMTEPE